VLVQLDEQVVGVALDQLGVDLVAKPLDQLRPADGNDAWHEIWYNVHKALWKCDGCGSHLNHRTTRGPTQVKT
jgi:hypothetical protein